MTKKFNSKNKVLGYLLILLGLFGSSTINKSQAQTYCSVGSYIGCLSGAYTYFDIERVIFRDVSGNVLLDKAADGCNFGTTTSPGSAGQGYTLISSKPSFTLSSGTKYSMEASSSYGQGTTGYTGYTVYFYVWIDLNRDGDFTDAGEYQSTGWAGAPTGAAPGTSGTLAKNFFTVPCNLTAGTSRLRIISSYNGYILNAGFSCSSGSSSWYYGEAEDYTVNLAMPTSLAAGFFMPSTAFVGTPVKMTNNNQTGYISHQWDIDANNTVEYNTTNATHIFPTAGTKSVQLKSTNCLGRDSITKFITISAPTSKPVVDFVSNTNEIERFGTVNFLDLSTQGPTYWSWYMYDPVDSAGTRADVESYNFNLIGSNPYQNANPAVFFNRTGDYTVCLQTSNGQGPSSILCKKNYIRVTPFKDNNMGAGTVQPIYESSGNIIDDGGRTGNYSKNRIDYATIIPCGAKKITLTFSQFKLGTNANLKIFDGTDASFPPLHSGSGFTSTNKPVGPIIATSGAMYLYFTTDGSVPDSGFIASWVTEKGAVAAPIASFSIPDTLYNPNSYTYINTSQNVLGKTDYIWSIEPGYGEVGYTKDLDYALLTDNTYDVTLEATTCIGTSKFTKSVVVVTPHTKAGLDFNASNRRPSTGDIVTLTATGTPANKAIKADKFKWNFFPGTVQYQNGTSSSDQVIQVKFTAKGKYTVSMRGWNSLDSSATSNQVIKSDYVIVVEHCIPILSISPSSDIAINNVTLSDLNGIRLIDNNSLTNTTTGYDDYTSTNIKASLSFGGMYNISTSRSTNINPMSRKIWIDYNIDGDFDDAGELIASESPALTNNFSQNFTVPDISKAFEGQTRMRVGTSYSTDPNEPCGAGSGKPNANRLGEFEDYRIILVNDGQPPVLTLNNDDTLYLEVGTTYTEYGATAMDPSEGNISSKITITSDLDMAFTGIYYLTYNVKDAGGNAALPVTRVVYVVKDQTAPSITLNGSDTVWVEVYGTYNEDGANATDNKDGNITNAIVISGKVNTSLLGTYILTYAVNDVAGNSASKQRVVIVRDTQKPVIANTDADVNNEVKVQIVSVFIDRTTVTDNYPNPTLIATPGSSGPVDTRFKGTYPVIYDAMDVSGNKADTKTYKYLVDDYIGPIITLNTLDTIIHPVNRAYSPVQAKVDDNYYNNTQVSITQTSNVNAFKLGTYYDEYTATDGSGNITKRRRTVRVVDQEAPIIGGSAMNVGLYSTVDASEGLTITDNYDAPSVLLPKLQVVFNNLNTYVEGIYSVTFRVADLSGNLSMPYERTIWVSRNFPTIQGSISTLDKDKAINVYPNPSTGIVNISYNFATPETMEVQVYNATGSLVAELNNIHGQNGVQTIDLGNEASGLYTLRMRVNGRQITRKVSIRR